MLIGNNNGNNNLNRNNNFNNRQIVNNNNFNNNQMVNNNSFQKRNPIPENNMFTKKATEFKHVNPTNNNDISDKSLAILHERLKNNEITMEEFSKKCEQIGKMRQIQSNKNKF